MKWNIIDYSPLLGTSHWKWSAAGDWTILDPRVSWTMKLYGVTVTGWTWFRRVHGREGCTWCDPFSSSWKLMGSTCCASAWTRRGKECEWHAASKRWNELSISVPSITSLDGVILSVWATDLRVRRHMALRNGAIGKIERSPEEIWLSSIS